ncbi:MAG: hypothetical protein ACR2JJ_01185 [Sphingomicrobium sp.]
MLTASPVTAQSAPQQQRPAPQQQQQQRLQQPLQVPMQMPPELSDPRMAERLAQMTQVLGKAFLNLPVGELEAIAEGRPATAADRRRTVRESGRDKDPNFERDFAQQMAQAGPTMATSMKALSGALPAMMQSLQHLGAALERATANMPSPDYPKR